MNVTVEWHHAPLHVFVPNVCYMITAGTLRKAHLFRGEDRLALLHDDLLGIMRGAGWELRAWAVFSNHYHCIVKAPDGDVPLTSIIRRLHSQTAREVNRLDGTPGRQVWHQYWDRCLTYERSYLARLKYVKDNAVHHKLTPIGSSYRFCSAAWFETTTTPAFQRKVESFACDTIKEPDDYNPV